MAEDFQAIFHDETPSEACLCRLYCATEHHACSSFYPFLHLFSSFIGILLQPELIITSTGLPLIFLFYNGTKLFLPNLSDHFTLLKQEKPFPEV